MKKREFAARLLFWLLPWPISKVFPRSLRIYYWGPAAGPPSGWYDYWGVPGFYWPDPDVPPDPDLFPDLPDDPFNPGDPVDPTPPDHWPDLPSGPNNPGDPLTPGPGPGVPVDQPDNFTSYFDDTFWEPKGNGGDKAVWDAVNKHWDSVLSGLIHVVELTPLGTWFVGTRFSVVRITFTVHNTLDFYIVDSAELLLLHEDPAYSNFYIALDFYRGNDIGWIRFWASDNTPFSVTNIELL